MISIKALMPLFILLGVLPGEPAEQKQELGAHVSLRVVPQAVTLRGAQASQHFLALAEYADGLERDVTARAHFSISEVKKGQIDSSGRFVARSAGADVLTAEFGRRSARTAIRI